jgi:hypothetical protein
VAGEDVAGAVLFPPVLEGVGLNPEHAGLEFDLKVII